jgi:hypothetical protein
VQAKVAELRQAEVKFKDTVPDQNPSPVSPCNLWAEKPAFAEPGRNSS